MSKKISEIVEDVQFIKDELGKVLSVPYFIYDLFNKLIDDIESLRDKNDE